MRFLDIWIAGWVARLIFVHLLFCLGAFVGLFGVPAIAWEFIDKTLDAKRLVESGTPMKLELVHDHSDERFFKDRGYRYYFSKEGFSGYSYRDKPTKDLDYLMVYQESFEDESNPWKRLVEVPEEVSIRTVYQATWGRSWLSGLAGVLIAFLVWIVVTYVAIKGYLFIKRGAHPPRSRKSHRRRRRA